MIGTRATAQEIKARWAYSEIPSSRFGKHYVGHTPAHLDGLARSGAPFSQVASTDWPTLVSLIENFGRDKSFVDNIDVNGGPHYVCAGWGVQDLLNCLTIPVFDQAPYPVFLSRPPNRDALGQVDDADPRYCAYNLPFSPHFTQSEPAIVIRPGGANMLLEGYLRSILWLRLPTTPFLVWLPV